ncbi:MAG: DUF948 domain-containing protein [Olsenella sp.]|nr:DUF948 domain-containing protein [Olsenella sp.]
MMTQIDPLTILLMVLVVAAVWAVIELALTVRKARSSVDQITRSANDTIEQVQPIIAKLDGAMDDVQPSIKQIDPLVSKVSVTLDEANASLHQVSGILEDVSSVSGTAANVTDAVSQVANTAASAATGIVNKISRKSPAPANQLEGAVPAQIQASADDATRDTGYVTYGETRSEEDDSTDESK